MCSASYSGSFFSGRGPECHTACGMCCQNTFFNNDGRIDLVHGYIAYNHFKGTQDPDWETMEKEYMAEKEEKERQAS